jgi:hypothetical protein
MHCFNADHVNILRASDFQRTDKNDISCSGTNIWPNVKEEANAMPQMMLILTKRRMIK